MGRKYKNLRGRNEIFFIFIFSLLAINVTDTLWEYILGNLSQKIMVQYTFKQSSQIATFLVFFLKFRLSPHFSWKSNSGCWNFNSIKSDSSVWYNVWTEFSGHGFKSHSSQLSIATSKNLSGISSFRYTDVVTLRKLWLKQTWRLTKAISEVKSETEQTVKLK